MNKCSFSQDDVFRKAPGSDIIASESECVKGSVIRLDYRVSLWKDYWLTLSLKIAEVRGTPKFVELESVSLGADVLQCVCIKGFQEVPRSTYRENQLCGFSHSWTSPLNSTFHKLGTVACCLTRLLPCAGQHCGPSNCSVSCRVAFSIWNVFRGARLVLVQG